MDKEILEEIHEYIKLLEKGSNIEIDDWPRVYVVSKKTKEIIVNLLKNYVNQEVANNGK